MIARGQLHVEETRPVKDSADAVLCMFAAEASMHAGDGCVFVLISEDAIFLQAQTTLQAKRRTVMLVRSRSYDEVGTIVVQLNHQTMDDLVYLDGVRRGGKTAAQKGGAFGAAGASKARGRARSADGVDSLAASPPPAVDEVALLVLGDRAV